MRFQLVKYTPGSAGRLCSEDVPLFSSNSDIFVRIYIVEPTRCTNVSNLFYFGMILYMFHILLLHISDNADTCFRYCYHMFQILLLNVSDTATTCIRNCYYTFQILLLHVSDNADCLLASSQQYQYACCCIHSLELLMMDGKAVRNI